MTVRVYKSTDSGAPTITDVNGSLIALLKACLVTGYGSSAAAGWTNPYNSGSTIAVFRSPTGTKQRYLRVVDSGYNASVGYREARCRGYEVMTAVSTGTGLFPTTAQVAGNGIPYMYGLASGNPYINDWILVATEAMFHLYVNTGDNATVVSYYSNVLTFGDFISYKAGDSYNTIIRTGNDGDIPYYGGSLCSSLNSPSNSMAYIARKQTQTGTAEYVTFGSNTLFNSSTYMGGGGIPYPNRPDSGLVLSNIFLINPDIVGSGANAYIAGVVPGIWDICHTTPTAHKDTWTQGSKSFIGLRTIGSTEYCLETSNTW